MKQRWVVGGIALAGAALVLLAWLSTPRADRAADAAPVSRGAVRYLDEPPSAPGAVTFASGPVTAMAIGAQSPASFDMRSDLFALYEAALTTNRGADAARAARVVRECHGLLVWFDEHYGVIAAGGRPEADPGPFSQARMDAIREVIRRCDGFNRMAPAQRREAISRLTARARELGSPEAKFQLEGAAAMSGRDVVAMLQEASGSNFEALLIPLSHIAEQWAIHRNGLERERASSVGGMGAMLALCDLSDTCRSDSLRGVLWCATGGKCGAALTDGWEDGLSPQEQALVLEYRARIVAAVRSGQWSTLGLP